MFEFDITSVISLSLVCGTILLSVKILLSQSEKNQKREHDQELMKVRMYTDRDVRTAQIENSAYNSGFDGNMDSIEGLMNVALKNPEIIKTVLEKVKK